MERKGNETEFLPLFAPIKTLGVSRERIPIGGDNRLLKTYHENDQLNGYKILKLCASGGMGKIYLCRQIYDGELYILKMIAPDKSTRTGAEMMMQELKRMNCIPAHPNVISIHEVFIHNDMPHIIMEYAQGVNENGIAYGSSLQDLFEHHYKFSFIDVLWIALSVCRGLSHCQQNIEGFVHGDIKPSNILFQPLGDRAVFNGGMGKYQVKIADFGGGKTQGYYVSGREEASTAEDDIYAFAKTMELLFKAACETGGVSQENLYYWDRFWAGLKGMLYEEYSSELRKSLNFLSLYNGYAEAFEVAMGLHAYGYFAEDVIPQKNSEIKAEVVEIINACARNIAIRNTETAEATLLDLLNKTGIEEVYFDDLPAVMIIWEYLVEIYFWKNQWKAFDKILGKMKERLKKLSFPIRYNGYFMYSTDIKTDIEIIEQLGHMRKDEYVDVERLIAAVRLDVDSGIWLEWLLHYIAMKDKKKAAQLEKQIFSLQEPPKEESSKLVRYHCIKGSYYWYNGCFSKACPHYQFLTEMDIDRLEYSYRYALGLYSTGNILKSMMYFEHVYDIYSKEGAYNNEDWYTVEMGLMSLLYMCDYKCFMGHCQLYTLKQESLDESVRNWLNATWEICNRCQTLVNEWRKIEQRVLYEKNEHNDIGEIKWMKERTRKVLEEGEIVPFGIRHRAASQIFYESARALARVCAHIEAYDLAIQECDDILRMDQSNFNGYQIRSECYIMLWRESGREEYRVAAVRDMEAALKCVHFMFPGKNGGKSSEAKQWEEEIHKRLEYMGYNL